MGSSLAGAFWELCLLKRRPQDIPFSPFLFKVVVCGYFLRCTAINLVGFPFAEAILLGAVMTVLLLAVFEVLLLIRGYRKRMLQTVTAMMGTKLVLFPAAFALRYWFHIIEQSGTRSDLAGYLWVLLFVWGLFIAAHILRHALNARLIVGFFIAIAYLFLEFRVMFIVHHEFAQWLV
ncbi:MAG: hypothetical protein QF609_02580 [Gammaproteobacteria bacterium]|nr:hypothetical protein [Gammaproteobacteria bacterium]